VDLVSVLKRRAGARLVAVMVAVIAGVASLLVMVTPAGAQAGSDANETTIVAGRTRTVEPNAMRTFPAGQGLGRGSTARR